MDRLIQTPSNLLVAFRGLYREKKYLEAKVQYLIKGKIIPPVSLAWLKGNIPSELSCDPWLNN